MKERDLVHSALTLRPLIILVHGTGAYGLEMIGWRWMLYRRGYRTRVFSYAPYRETIEESAAKLGEFVARQDARVIHFVGHSLGGLVVLQYLAHERSPRCGRVVNIATPHSGSVAARRVMRIPFGRWILGKALCQCAAQGVPFPEDKEVGAISGTFNFIIGWLLWLPRPNDSLVTCRDVEHPELKDFIALKVSHASSLLSRRVVRQIDHFIRHGRFQDGKLVNQALRQDCRISCESPRFFTSVLDCTLGIMAFFNFVCSPCWRACGVCGWLNCFIKVNE